MPFREEDPYDPIPKPPGGRFTPEWSTAVRTWVIRYVERNRPGLVAGIARRAGVNHFLHRDRLHSSLDLAEAKLLDRLDRDPGSFQWWKAPAPRIEPKLWMWLTKTGSHELVDQAIRDAPLGVALDAGPEPADPRAEDALEDVDEVDPFDAVFEELEPLLSSNVVVRLRDFCAGHEVSDIALKQDMRPEYVQIELIRIRARFPRLFPEAGKISDSVRDPGAEPSARDYITTWILDQKKFSVATRRDAWTIAEQAFLVAARVAFALEDGPPSFAAIARDLSRSGRHRSPDAVEKHWTRLRAGNPWIDELLP